MQTECVRCHKMIDTVQGYKFSATEYVCMSCYDAYKAERTARAKKQHKNPLIDQFGAGGTAPAATRPRRPVVSRPQEPPTVQPPPQPPAEPQAAPQEAPSAPPQQKPVPAPSPPKTSPSAEVCDVCKKPIPDFKIPLKGGKKVCMDCNGILRELAKALILNVKCPNCGKEIQLTGE